ncbi:MAG: 4Fe-4S binding protein [Clostridiales bacterium]|jgi:Fe-S-cluster-containing hydrogenase component 2|nr:4Fe-4S binding protein [Clostridiales bacterium]
MVITINKDKCPQNHKCPAINVCPQDAITQGNIYSPPVIDKEKCVNCGRCVHFCPKGAFERKKSDARGQTSTAEKI